MTYRELLNKLNELSPNRLEDTVSIYLSLTEEVIEVETSFIVTETEGHFVLQVDL